ncbi:MAG: biopolymer transporter ExbD [Deltaproteobacteria bacterium]|nr:biopolymer transporter ExbD [Deltaproteobacteria bacterium]MBW2136181.1 biopolymer transporter ExbD [Deltaproteobacteria bacterium]
MKVNFQALRKARIEMLPLIDIVFLLLVFFIYAMLSMAVHRGLPVRLPFSSTAKIERELVLSITVKEDGTIYLDKKRVRLEHLEEALKSKVAEEKGQGVLLFADRALKYQDLFRILDRIRMAGLTKISLQAQVEP